jgi:hypothetical protein
VTEKTARANIRKALALFRKRIRFPRIRLRDILESEDIVTAIKEFAGNKVLKTMEGR